MKGKRSLFIILVFLLSVYGKKILFYLFDLKIVFNSPILNLLYGYSWWIIPVCITLIILYGYKNVLKELSINKGFLKGTIWAFIMVLPMLAGSLIIGKLNENITTLYVLKATLIAGFMEEILFRGFLFGQLFRRMKWGFIPAVVINAVIFGLGHIYQGNNIGETTGVFMVTLLGGAWFAWLYIEWQENLWFVIMLHTFMNLSWTIFVVSSTALGAMDANIFRLMTIVLTVLITIYKRRKAKSFMINRNNLLFKRID